MSGTCPHGVDVGLVCHSGFCGDGSGTGVVVQADVLSKFKLRSSPVKTVWVSIGNSDDKLSQRQWSSFCRSIRQIVDAGNVEIFAEVYSHGDARYQNAHWGFILTPRSHPDIMKRDLITAARLYRQDSIAWLEGETEFLRP